MFAGFLFADGSWENGHPSLWHRYGKGEKRERRLLFRHKGLEKEKRECESAIISPLTRVRKKGARFIFSAGRSSGGEGGGEKKGGKKKGAGLLLQGGSVGRGRDDRKTV